MNLSNPPLAAVSSSSINAALPGLPAFDAVLGGNGGPAWAVVLTLAELLRLDDATLLLFVPSSLASLVTLDGGGGGT